MNRSLDQSMEYLSLANSTREQYSNSAGDFANSGEGEKYMPKVMELINQSSGPGMNPPQSGMTAAQTGMPSAQTHANSGNEAASSGMKQIQNPQSLEAPDNTADNTGNIPQYNMPKKQVLTEPCTISQPLNSSLRDNFSTGTFYFLK
jgi:hypothetical protein